MTDPIQLLSDRVQRFGRRQVCTDADIDPSYLSLLLAGKRGVGDKVLTYLGLKVVYERDERTARQLDMPVSVATRRSATRSRAPRNRLAAKGNGGGK